MENREVALTVSNMLMEIIDQQIPYHWVRTKEPFLHPYKDKVCYDYSGEVKLMTEDEFQAVIAGLGNRVCYSSDLEELLDTIYINQWYPTYESNCGKHWLSYKNLLEQRFNDWKCNNFELYDDDGNELNEALNLELDQQLYDFLEHMSGEIYVRKILRKWR
ncbi:hypothetical protein PDUR_02870 [Paenibacillus durus]|uniref:Uncharacterized protein n=2 Tax=Paenibacillus durus TaxID=44251 RepID=A0A089HK51_PAEDU|nr:hypothetical protein PDUR_02870 [Paenibacillus durus]